MKIEKAQLRDISILVDLRLEFLREDNGYLEEHDAESIRNGLPAYFKAHLDKDIICYVLRDGNDIVSCAFLLIVEKPLSPAFLNGKTGTVLNVYTRPAFRHRGYAKMVMEELIADAKRMDLCVMELKATDAGYPLYRSLGFADDLSKYHPMKLRSL